MARKRYQPPDPPERQERPVAPPIQLPVPERGEKHEQEALPPAPSCDNCAYWLRYLGSKMGFCRRYPPQIVNPTHLTSSGPAVIHGLTSADSLCGEHPRFNS